MEAATTIPKVTEGHAPHPNYVKIFIWLIILTAIEVAIPEVIQIEEEGPNSNLPTVVDAAEIETAPTLTAEQRTEYLAAYEKIAPEQTYAALPWTAKIGVLAFLAVVKAALVGAFFMHMRFDGWKLNVIMAVPTMLFFVIIILTFPDIAITWPSLY
ncbi:MAG: cytochrome C oxidase subunit IV family protein [Phycisphaerales bacterium]